MHWLSVLLRSARRFWRSLIAMVFTAPYALRSPVLKPASLPCWASISQLRHCCLSPHSDSELPRMVALGAIVLIRAQFCSAAGGKAGHRCVAPSALRMPSVAIPGCQSRMRPILTLVVSLFYSVMTPR
jgi:hypothetical protein